jgi:flagellar biosynthesis protein FlhG
MKDQAQRLREIIRNSKIKKTENQIIRKTGKTRVIAVTSGKGGVGKSNFTVNLAISLINLGYRVVILDADIGLANVDILLGIIPKYTIADIIYNGKDILEVMIDGPNNLKIIAGGSGLKDLIEISSEQLNKLINELYKLEEYADFILIDTGAGLSNMVLNFVNAANEIIIVTTPEPTSLTDAYAMIKAITMYGNHEKLNVIINGVEDNNEGDEVLRKLNRVVERFLKASIVGLGYIYKSRLVVDSVKNQRPFTLLYPNSDVSKKINSIAINLISGFNNEENYESGFGSFVKKIKAFFGKGG